MDILDGLRTGFEVALSLKNLGYCFLGVLLGTLVGVLPGLGPLATISMLLPITFTMGPETALIMLAGIYYGAQYGGSTTAILLNMPGEASSVITALDGNQMARKGRAGAALTIAALGSFFAGSVATLLIALVGPTLAQHAIKFSPMDYFSLILLGLVASVALGSGKISKSLAMIGLGLLVAVIGTDVNTSQERFTFNLPELTDGINFVVLSMGVYGIAEIFSNLARSGIQHETCAVIGTMRPTREEIRQSIKPVLRGTALGSLLGVLPGGGALLASFASYALEKQISSTPEKFGTGCVEGVAAPESANNAGAQTSFIPLLTLGIPANALMAMVIGALLVQGITPGPQLITERPTLFWGVIASMWIGNAMLIVLNLPLVGIWVRLLSAPYRFLFPLIALICCLGAYSVNNSTFDLYLLALASLAGYVFYLLDCEPAPFLMGYILGPLLEENFRRAMQMAGGDLRTVLDYPVTVTFLIASVLLIAITLKPSIGKVRTVAFQEP